MFLYLLIIFVTINDPESSLLVERFQHGKGCLSVDLKSSGNRLLQIDKVGPRPSYCTTSTATTTFYLTVTSKFSWNGVNPEETQTINIFAEC